MLALYILLAGWACVLTPVRGYAVGPPVVACDTLKPQHGVEPMTSSCSEHFSIITEYKGPCASADVTIRIEPISRDTYAWYEGFMMVAKQGSESERLYGTFSTLGDNQLQTIPCMDRTGSAIGHHNKYHYTDKTFKWTPPSDTEAEFTLHATIVYEKAEYWMGCTTTVDVCTEAQAEPDGAEPEGTDSEAPDAEAPDSEATGGSSKDSPGSSDRPRATSLLTGVLLLLLCYYGL